MLRVPVNVSTTTMPIVKDYNIDI